MVILSAWILAIFTVSFASTLECDAVVDGNCVINSTRAALPGGAELSYKGNGSVHFINATWKCTNSLLVEALHSGVALENTTISGCSVLKIAAHEGNLTLDKTSLINSTATVFDGEATDDERGYGGSLGGSGGALGRCDRGDQVRGIDFTVMPDDLLGEGTAVQCRGGGGVVLISDQGYVVSDGCVQANGASSDAHAQCGGGSGGAVSMTGVLGVLAGQVQADGGDCSGKLGCGGGGRIHLASQNGTVSPSEEIHAYGGSGAGLPECLCGSPGTVYYAGANGSSVTVGGRPGSDRCAQTTVVPQKVKVSGFIVIDGNVTVRLCGEDDGNSCVDSAGGADTQVSISADEGTSILGGAKLAGPSGSSLGSSMVMSVGNGGLRVGKGSSVETAGSLSILAATSGIVGRNGGTVALERQSSVTCGPAGMKISTQGDIDAGGTISIRGQGRARPAWITEDAGLYVDAAGTISLSEVVSEVEVPIVVSAGAGLTLGTITSPAGLSEFRATRGDVIVSGNITLGPATYCKQRKLWIEDPPDLCMADPGRLDRLVPLRTMIVAKTGGMRLSTGASVNAPVVIMCSPQGQLELPPRGQVSSKGRGCPAGEGRGSGGPGRDGHCGGGGGGHVGSGAPGCSGNQGMSYDDQDPLETGVIPSASASGGGGEEGGAGGGVVWISAAQARIDGNVSSDGARGGWTVGDTSGSGGGAGGSVLILVNTSLVGSGMVSAAGGNGSGPPVLKGGDGGGGFIGISWLGPEVGENDFAGPLEVTGAEPGHVGQILPCPSGRHGALCASCPRGTWSSTGGPVCNICTNAPWGVSNYTKEGVQDPDCPYACLPGYPDVSQNPACLNPWQYTLSFIGGVPGAFTLLLVLLFALLASIATSEIRKRSRGDDVGEMNDSAAAGEGKVMTADDIPRHVSRLYLHGANIPADPFSLPPSLGDLPQCVAELVSLQQWGSFATSVNSRGRGPAAQLINLWGRWARPLLSVFCYPLWRWLSRSQQERRSQTVCDVVFAESGDESLWRADAVRRSGRIYTIRFGCDGGRDGSYSKAHIDVLDMSVRVEHWESSPSLPALIQLSGDGSYMSPLRIPRPGWDPMASGLAVMPQDVSGWTSFVANVNDTLLPMTFHGDLVPPAELSSICATLRRASDAFLVPNGIRALMVMIPEPPGAEPAVADETARVASAGDSTSDPFLGGYSSFEQISNVEHVIAANSSSSTRFPGFCKTRQICLVLVNSDDPSIPPQRSDRPFFFLRPTDVPSACPGSPLDLATQFTLEEVDIHEYAFRWAYSTSSPSLLASIGQGLWSPVKVSLSNRRPQHRVVIMSRVALQASVLLLLLVYATLTAMQLTWYLGISPVAFLIQLVLPPLGDLLALTLGAVWVVLSYTPWARWFVCFVVATFINNITGFLIRLAASSPGSPVMTVATLAVEYTIVISVKICLCITSNMLLAHHLGHSPIPGPSTPERGPATRTSSGQPTPATPRYLQFSSRELPMPPPLRVDGAVPSSIIAEMRGSAGS
ncbi:hypothetical protein FOL47_011112 [Perkinsus chesapeaki]|uniref:DUF8003 domain-containing protein n=1 Tax=Perkinsus chesapeaki TaxID=330153 RepID=A0A7J6MP44_PERCH|nr:hypothetical protein FOL47_011112 [Perkinsus chesapeaki]